MVFFTRSGLSTLVTNPYPLLSAIVLLIRVPSAPCNQTAASFSEPIDWVIKLPRRITGWLPSKDMSPPLFLLIILRSTKTESTALYT